MKKVVTLGLVLTAIFCWFSLTHKQLISNQFAYSKLYAKGWPFHYRNVEWGLDRVRDDPNLCNALNPDGTPNLRCASIDDSINYTPLAENVAICATAGFAAAFGASKLTRLQIHNAKK